MCSGSTDFYLAGLAARSGDTAAADRHYRAAAGCHRRLGARPMLAHTLHEHARLLDPSAASTALAEARAIAADCGMTKLLAVLDQAEQPRKPGHLTLRHEDDFWLVGFADARHPGTGQPGPALPGPAHPPSRPGAGRPGPESGSPPRSARPQHHQKTDCTTRPEPGPTRSSTSRPEPPTGSASPASTRNSPKPRRGTTPSGPAACAPRRTSWSASSPPRPGSAAGHGASARNPNAPGSTSPGPSGPRSPGSATAPRPPPPTSTGPSGPAPAAPTPRRTARAEHANTASW